jgi:hypothetical protein
LAAICASRFLGKPFIYIKYSRTYLSRAVGLVGPEHEQAVEKYLSDVDEREVFVVRGDAGLDGLAQGARKDGVHLDELVSVEEDAGKLGGGGRNA